MGSPQLYPFPFFQKLLPRLPPSATTTSFAKYQAFRSGYPLRHRMHRHPFVPIASFPQCLTLLIHFNECRLSIHNTHLLYRWLYLQILYVCTLNLHSFKLLTPSDLVILSIIPGRILIGCVFSTSLDLFSKMKPAPQRFELRGLDWTRKYGRFR